MTHQTPLLPNKPAQGRIRFRLFSGSCFAVLMTVGVKVQLTIVAIIITTIIVIKLYLIIIIMMIKITDPVI